ncbi:MAG: hypothetical protein AB7F67_03825 [Rhodospirillaceae bacterium]
MTAVEFDEWRAFFAVEPWGEERADLRAALTTAAVYNVNRGRGQSAFKPIDFMPNVKHDRDQLARRRALDPAAQDADRRSATDYLRAFFRRLARQPQPEPDQEGTD